MHFPEPRSCKDLSEEMFALYSQSSNMATSLLDYMARMSTPYDCEAYILSFFSRIVMRFWLQGDASLTIIPVSNYTSTFTLATEPENDDPEIIYQNDFNVSTSTILEILSFSNAVLPFVIEACSTNKIILTAKTDKRLNTLPPSEFTYADGEIQSDHPEGISLFAQTKESTSEDCTGVYLRPPPVGTLLAALVTTDVTEYKLAHKKVDNGR